MFHQLPVAEADIMITALIGKFCFKKGSWCLKRLVALPSITSIALGNIGPKNSLLCYVADLICCFLTWDAHVASLERMFQALQAAALTMKRPQW